MAQLRLDPSRQLLGAPCTGTLVLARLGLLDDVPACTDLSTKPWVEAAGIEVLNLARLNVAWGATRATFKHCSNRPDRPVYIDGWVAQRMGVCPVPTVAGRA
jgi:hypothetical protein